MNKKSRLRLSRGFTLIELLTVSAIMVIVALEIYSAFNSGIAVWGKIRKGAIEEDAILFFEKLSYDLENILPYSGMDFEGKQKNVTFPARVRGSLGRVTYRLNEEAQGLTREEQDYSEVCQESDGKRRRLTEGVNALCFYYLGYDEEQEGWLWKETWQEKNLPSAVKVEIELKNDIPNYKLSRIIPIPLSFIYSVHEND